MTTVLALETSCDETAVAILCGRDDHSGHELLASEVASQVAAHEKFGGVVPEIASRNHLIYAPRLLDRATSAAKIDLSEVDAFAATSGPGLASSLMIGASIAKGLAIGFGKPYLAINHLEGHLLSPFFSSGIGVLPISGASAGSRWHISLIVSGGHTMSVLVRGLADYQVIGRTVDDAAGEAFDKVAKMLELGYPGGPEIEKRARGGEPNRFDLPRSMLSSENFSFSGLKTAVRYLLPKIGVIPSRGDGGGPRIRSLNDRGSKRDQSPSERSFAFAQNDKLLSDLCASFQQAIIDVLVAKTLVAAEKYHVDVVTVSGGVSCNQELRWQLHEACSRKGFEFKSAEPWLCTDNAAMIAFAALLRLQAGFQSKLTEEIDPNLALA
ncbi:MAG: tRNA (adenosine(37)-N6)-threonylcarbamoyltransferase complex transferase subunit TsaD [Candidatus Udaeobacter sp.]